MRALHCVWLAPVGALRDPATNCWLPFDRTYSHTVDRVAWSHFRNDDRMRFIGLVAPDVLLRDAPDVVAHRHQPSHPAERPLWLPGSVAVAVLVARAFAQTGWPAAVCPKDGAGILEQVGASGMLSELNLAPLRVPLARRIPPKHEPAAAEDGIMTLRYDRRRQALLLHHAPTVQHGDDLPEYGSSLPHVLLECRTTHALMAAGRDCVGLPSPNIETYLRSLSWMKKGNPSAGVEELKAERPFKEAVPKVVDASETYPLVSLSLTPYYQELEQFEMGWSYQSDDRFGRKPPQPGR